MFLSERVGALLCRLEIIALLKKINPRLSFNLLVEAVSRILVCDVEVIYSGFSLCVAVVSEPCGIINDRADRAVGAAESLQVRTCC